MSRIVPLLSVFILALATSQVARADGFELHNARSRDRCLRPLGPPQAGTPLGLGRCDENGERFHFEGMTLRHHGLCVDDSGGLGRPGDALVLYPCHGRVNQQWTLARDGSLRGINGLCAGVRPGNDGRRAEVVLRHCRGDDDERWFAREDGGAVAPVAAIAPPAPVFERPMEGRIESRLAPNLCLNVLGGVKDRATVGVWGCGNAPNSQFVAKRGHLEVQGLCVSARRDNSLVTRDCNDPRVLTWTAHGPFLETSDGRCLDLEGGRMAPGTRVMAWPCNRQQNEKWSFSDELARRLDRANWAEAAAPAPMPPPMVLGVAPDDFHAIVHAIKHESFPRDQMNALRSGSDGRRFTSEQIGRLVDLFSFSEQKVEVVKMLHRSMVDPQNGFQLLEHFTFGADKAKVREILSH